ncbi:MAG: hypothetical protein JW862_18615 [Anaerolineales bacterium]|nr:hypothetical protein [Anaerolineales bacterium]
MKLKVECQYLVDRYVDEVSLRLPRRGRTDIAAEIRSLILAALEDRAEQAGQPPDESLTLEVLKAMGPPQQMAASYQRAQYLIGPKMYPSFLMTLQVVLALVGISFFIGLGFSLTYTSNLYATLGQHLLDLLQTVIRAFGIVVLIFAILERVLPEQDWETQLQVWGRFAQNDFLRKLLRSGDDWNPEQLRNRALAQRVGRVGLTWEMGLVLFLMVLFNFFPHKVGAFGLIDSQSWFLPLLSSEFSRYLVGWNLYWALVLANNFAQLILGYRTRVMQWIEIGLMLFSAVLVYWMLVGPPVLGLNPDYLALNQTGPRIIAFAEETLLPILTILLEVAFAVHLVLKAIALAYKIFQLLKFPSLPVWTIKRDE